MSNAIYRINKGINRPLEIRGLKAQYIGYLAVGLIAVLILFSIMYIAGLNAYLCVLIGFCLGSAVFFLVYKLNNKYGPHGLSQLNAKRSIPKVIKSKSRKFLLK